MLTCGASLDVVIYPLARYLDSGSLSLGGIQKVVLGTTFDRDQVFLFSLAPTNIGEGEPKATPSIVPNGDKDLMLFVIHSKLRATF
jgi:hypothetical protein